MIKGFRQIASLTVVSRILGMIRDMAFAAFFGAGGLMDAWIIAFQIPNLSRRLFGEGAASASFIPVYRQQLNQNPEQAKKLASTVVTVIFTLLTAIVLFGWASLVIYTQIKNPNPQTKTMLSLIAVMLPYMIMICTVALMAGILNVHAHFAAPAAAPIILNVSIISTILLTSWVFNVPKNIQIFLVAISVLIAGVVQIAIQIPQLKKAGVHLKPQFDVKSDAFKKVTLMMTPMIIGLTATQINTLADTWIAKIFSGSELKGQFFHLFGHYIKYPLWDGAVSHLYYSQRLYQFPLGVLGISLATAIFPVMSANAAEKDYNALAKTTAKAINATIFIALPAIAGLIIVARPLVAAVFQRGRFTVNDTTQTAHILLFYALGLCGFFAQQVLTRAFYSIQDSKTPMKSAILAVCVNLVLNLILIWPMSTAGLALSTALASYLQVTILAFILQKKYARAITDSITKNLKKTFLATAAMSTIAVITSILLKTLPRNTIFDIFRLIEIVTVSITTYFIASKLMKNRMLSLVTNPESDPAT